MRGRAKGGLREGAHTYATGSAHPPANLPALPSLGTPPRPTPPIGLSARHLRLRDALLGRLDLKVEDARREDDHHDAHEEAEDAEDLRAEGCEGARYKYRGCRGRRGCAAGAAGANGGAGRAVRVQQGAPTDLPRGAQRAHHELQPSEALAHLEDSEDAHLREGGRRGVGGVGARAYGCKGAGLRRAWSA